MLFLVVYLQQLCVSSFSMLARELTCRFCASRLYSRCRNKDARVYPGPQLAPLSPVCAVPCSCKPTQVCVRFPCCRCFAAMCGPLLACLHFERACVCSSLPVPDAVAEVCVLNTQQLGLCVLIGRKGSLPKGFGSIASVYIIHSFAHGA